MRQYSHWHYILGYLVVTTAHNWPAIIALAMSGRRAWLLYRTPTRQNVQWLYGWALLVFAYEYVKHLGSYLVEPVYFLLTTDWAWMRPWPAMAIELLAPSLIVLLALRLLLAAMGAPARAITDCRVQIADCDEPIMRDTDTSSGARASAEPGQPQAACTIVIPTYNERENIAALVPQIMHYPRFKVLVVDDNSPDGTGQVVADLARRYQRVGLLARPGKLGLGTAYVAGFKRALADGAQFIFEMDADFSHDPMYLPAILAAAETQYDIVLGSRYIPGGGTVGWGFMRQVISRGGNLYARTILGLSIKDCTGGFRCYRRRVLESLDLDAVRSNGYSFQIEMLYRAARRHFRIGEIPIVFPDRRVGASKMSRAIVREALVTVWRLRLFPDRAGGDGSAGQPLPEPVPAAESDRMMAP